MIWTLAWPSRSLMILAGMPAARAAVAYRHCGAVGWASADNAKQQCCLQRGRPRVLSTGIAYVLNYRLIQDEGPTAASMTNYLTPVVAVLLGVASWTSG